jgi:hypothetical protein
MNVKTRQSHVLLKPFHFREKYVVNGGNGEVYALDEKATEETGKESCKT